MHQLEVTDPPGELTSLADCVKASSMRNAGPGNTARRGRMQTRSGLDRGGWPAALGRSRPATRAASGTRSSGTTSTTRAFTRY